MNRKVWATPFIVWMVLFTLAPIVLVVIYSLTDASGAFTLDNFAAFLDPIYINVLLRSIGMALLCCLAAADLELTPRNRARSLIGHILDTVEKLPK